MEIFKDDKAGWWIQTLLYIMNNKWTASSFSTNFLGKRWCFAFWMHYLTIATLLDYAVPVCTCGMFCFTGMMPVLPKIVLILPGADSSSSHEKKKGGKVCIFSWNHDVWMFDILNQHDGMHHFSC